MQKTRKSRLALLGLALTIGLTALPAQAEKVIKISHLNPGDPFNNNSGAMTSVFKSLVESGTNGSVKVQIFSDGQLGKDNEVIEQTRTGVIQSNISSAGGVAQHYPLIGVFDLPFAFPNISVVHDVMDKDSSFGQKLSADIEKQTGLKVLGILDSGGYFAISNSKRPVETLDDMKGLRIRTMTLPTHEAIITSLGAKPTPLPWAEVYTALQTGVADGQMNPVPIIAFAKFDEVQKYLTLTQHIITPYVWFMNMDFYNSLSDEEKSVIDYAAKAAVVAGRGISRIIEASGRGLPHLAQKMDVNSISAAERAKFAEVSQPAVENLISEKFGDEGVDMLKAMQASIEEAAK
ncbi:MAG: DctP family TRAP transporter solute-binding subunit [Gammaproteobacteria bacterium]|nr:DctP family TRAP transporter solute-binding subunit [Gammaproteobacteria bacterium]